MKTVPCVCVLGLKSIRTAADVIRETKIVERGEEATCSFRARGGARDEETDSRLAVGNADPRSDQAV